MLLVIIFFYSLALTLIFPSLFPTLPLTFFAPFLIFSYYRTGKTACLGLSLLCGLILDLFSAQMRFGIYGLNYTLTTYLLYRFKNNFFEDNFTTIPIMTILFTYFSAIIQICLVYALNDESIFSNQWISVELIKIPIYNAFYAAIAFALFPYFFPHKLKKTPGIIKLKGKVQ